MSTISDELKTVKTNIVNNINTENENLARERKALNVCMFNIPESKNDNKDIQFVDDLNKIKTLLVDKVNLKKEDLKAFRRVQTKANVQCRPLILKLTNKEIREKILNLRNLEYKEDNVITKIYVNPDRTKAEIEAYKKLRQELLEHRRNANEDEVFAIRGNKVVNLQPFRKDIRNYWDNHETST